MHLSYFFVAAISGQHNDEEMVAYFLRKVNSIWSDFEKLDPILIIKNVGVSCELSGLRRKGLHKHVRVAGELDCQ